MIRVELNELLRLEMERNLALQNEAAAEGRASASQAAEIERLGRELRQQEVRAESNGPARLIASGTRQSRTAVTRART